MSKQRVIIFDSPDGTGKTNISQALSKETGIPYFRMDTQHDNWRKGKFKTALEFDQTYISSFLRQTGHSAIFDRAYPSEWVYSQVFTRDTNTKVLFQVDEAFAKMGAIIVIPLRDDYRSNREDEVIPNNLLPEIHERYLEFKQWTQCKTVELYVEEYGDDLTREIPALLKAIMRLDEGAKHVVLEGG